MRYPVIKPCGVQGTNYADGDVLIDPPSDVVRSLTIYGCLGDPLPDVPVTEQFPGPADPPSIEQASETDDQPQPKKSKK